MRERREDCAHEVIGVDGLGKMPMKAAGQCPPAVLASRVRCKRYAADWRTSLCALALSQAHHEVVPVHARHSDIGEHNIEGLAIEHAQGLKGGVHGEDSCPGRLEHRGHDLPRIIIVVDEQYSQALQHRIAKHVFSMPGDRGGSDRVRIRQPDREARAQTFALACGGNTTAVRLDQVTHNGKAQPESAVAARGGPIHLVEPIEDVW